jgi:hypothetical protein
LGRRLLDGRQDGFTHSSKQKHACGVGCEENLGRWRVELIGGMLRWGMAGSGALEMRRGSSKHECLGTPHHFASPIHRVQHVERARWWKTHTLYHGCCLPRNQARESLLCSAALTASQAKQPQALSANLCDDNKHLGWPSKTFVSRFPVYLDTEAHSPDAEMSRLLALHKTCERLPISSLRDYRSMLGVATGAWCC